LDLSNLSRDASLWEKFLSGIRETQSRSRSADHNPSAAPNAFGLHIADKSSGCQEFCAEREILRGGDDGMRALTMDAFTGVWLPTASSYVCRVPEEHVDQRREMVCARRVLSLEKLAAES